MTGSTPVGTFSLVLHTHLPWLPHHGRWPVGEEWLYQAWAGSYLPLVRVLDGDGAVGALDTEDRVQRVPPHVGEEADAGQLETLQHLDEVEALEETEPARVPRIRGRVGCLVG